jgi:hypothetical protein
LMCGRRRLGPARACRGVVLWSACAPDWRGAPPGRPRVPRARALHTPVVPRAPLLADAGRRAFGLLDGRLLDERLRLAVQVPSLGRRWGGHGLQQCRGGDELLACSRRRVRVVDVEVGINAIAGLPAQLPRAFAARGCFPRNGGAKQPHRAVLFRQLGLELARLGQLRVDVGPLGGEGGGRLALRPGAIQSPEQEEPLRRRRLPRRRRLLGRWQ